MKTFFIPLIALSISLMVACGEGRPTFAPLPLSEAEKQPDTAQVFSGSFGNAPVAAPIPTYTPMPTYTPHPTYQARL